MLYYSVQFDGLWEGWFPSLPCTDDDRDLKWTFTRCQAFEGSRVRIPTKVDGPRAPITFGAFGIPVLDDSARQVFGTASTDVQLIVGDTDHAEPAWIMNVLTCRDCIDRTRTEGVIWRDTDHRADLAGQYRMVIDLRIDSARAVGHDVLRARDWMLPVLVSDRIAQGLADADCLAGVSLTDVS